MNNNNKIPSREIENLKCPECEKQFDRKSNLKRHMKVHEKPIVNKEELKCPQCEKQFDYKYYLERLMIVHTKPEEYVYGV